MPKLKTTLDEIKSSFEEAIGKLRKSASEYEEALRVLEEDRASLTTALFDLKTKEGAVNRLEMKNCDEALRLAGELKAAYMDRNNLIIERANLEGEIKSFEGRCKAMQAESMNLQEREQEIAKRENLVGMEERRLKLFEHKLNLVADDEKIRKALNEI